MNDEATTNTNPRSLHDAMRRIRALSTAAHSDLYAFVDNPGEYGAKEYMESVAEAVVEIGEIARWVSETYEHGVRRDAA